MIQPSSNCAFLADLKIEHYSNHVVLKSNAELIIFGRGK